MCKYIFINLLEHHLRLYLSHIIKYVAKQINNHVFLSSKKKKQSMYLLYFVLIVKYTHPLIFVVGIISR